MGRRGPEPWCAWLMPMVFWACIGMFIYTMYVNNCPSRIWVHKCVLEKELGRFSFEPTSENPLFGPSALTLKKVGGLDRKLVEQGERWRLFSCMFLHSGVVHLLFNSFALLSAGIQLEEEFGFLKIGTLYVLSGLGGSILSCLGQDPTRDTVSVGASGALFGFMGSMLSEFITNWSSHTNKCVQLTMLLMVICLNMLVGLIPGVDNMAHLGGFISGFFLGFVLLMRPRQEYFLPGYETTRRKSKYQCHQQFFWVVSLAILIAGYLYGIKLLFKGSHIEKIIPSIPIDDLQGTLTSQLRNATDHTS